MFDENFDFKIPEKVTHEVYAEPRMTDSTCSPLCVYVPTTQLMFKLIRACIGVESVKDLWFMKNKGNKRPQNDIQDED